MYVCVYGYKMKEKVVNSPNVGSIYLLRDFNALTTMHNEKGKIMDLYIPRKWHVHLFLSVGP